MNNRKLNVFRTTTKKKNRFVFNNEEFVMNNYYVDTKLYVRIRCLNYHVL